MSQRKKRSLKKYLKHRDEIRSGDLLLYSPNTTLGKIIEFKTKYEITHIGFVFRHPIIDNHIMSLEQLENGTTLCRLSKRIQHYHEKGKIYWLPLKEEYNCYRDDLLKTAILSASSTFPNRSLLSNFIAPTLVDYEKMLCSQHCFIPFEKWILGFTSHKKPYPGEFEKINIFRDKVLLTTED